MNQISRTALLNCAIALMAFSVQAQDSTQSSKTIQGYYRATDNKNLYIQCTAMDSLLIIKYLWSGDADTARPKSDGTFSVRRAEREQDILTVLSKNATGQPDSVNSNGMIWYRVARYKPDVKVARLTPAQLKQYVGIYHFQKDTNNLIRFLIIGNDLVLRDNQDTHLVPESKLNFYKKNNLWFTVDFTRDATGNITRALIVKRQVVIKNPPPAITDAQLHSFEGKYRSKSDSDNIIQLIARGKQLVVKQLWDNKQTIVTPLADLYFYDNAASYALQFVRDSDGIVRQAWLFDTNEFDKIL